MIYVSNTIKVPVSWEIEFKELANKIDSYKKMKNGNTFLLHINEDHPFWWLWYSSIEENISYEDWFLVLKGSVRDMIEWFYFDLSELLQWKIIDIEAIDDACWNYWELKYKLLNWKVLEHSYITQETNWDEINEQIDNEGWFMNDYNFVKDMEDIAKKKKEQENTK